MFTTIGHASAETIDATNWKLDMQPFSRYPHGVVGKSVNRRLNGLDDTSAALAAANLATPALPAAALAAAPLAAAALAAPALPTRTVCHGLSPYQ